MTIKHMYVFTIIINLLSFMEFSRFNYVVCFVKEFFSKFLKTLFNFSNFFFTVYYV